MGSAYIPLLLSRETRFRLSKGGLARSTLASHYYLVYPIPTPHRGELAILSLYKEALYTTLIGPRSMSLGR